MTSTLLAFRIFLAAYIALLLYHLWGDWQDSSPIELCALGAGLSAAIFAHTRSGTLLYALLLAHMAIEWIDHGTRHWIFEDGEAVFELVHLVFDVLFLTYLSRELWGRHAYTTVLLSLAGLSAASALAWGASPTIFVEAPSVQALQGIALGGILGCTLFHFYAAFRPRARADLSGG